MKWNETTASQARYGEVAEKIWGNAEVIWEDSESGWQGHATILAYTPDGKWWFYEWWYGSCSGCDTWEAQGFSDEQIEAEMCKSAACWEDAETMRLFLRGAEPVISESREPMTGGLAGGLDVLSGGTCGRHHEALAAMDTYLDRVETITPEKITKRLEGIRKTVDDPEGAHALEDDLRRDVLQAIADGCDEPRRLARLALKSEKIEFGRWMA